MSIVRMTFEELKKDLTPEQIKNIKETANRPITFDKDCLEMTPEQLKKFRRAYPRKEAKMG